MTTLREAMETRLRRFIDGERIPLHHKKDGGRLVAATDWYTGPSVVEMLQETQAAASFFGRIGSGKLQAANAHAKLTTKDIIVGFFEGEVQEWVAKCVDSALREHVLADADFIAERWPVQTFSQMLYGSGNEVLLGLEDPSLVGVHLIGGLVPIPGWPVEADYESVLRWWAASAPEGQPAPGAKPEDFWAHMLTRQGRQLLDSYLEFQSDIAPRWRTKQRGAPDEEATLWPLKLWLGLASEMPTLHPSTAAVIYLAEQRARRRVYAADAAQGTLEFFHELTGDDARGLRRRAAEDAIREEASDFVGDQRAVGDLEEELRVRLRALQEKAGFDQSVFDANELAEENGILAFDARYVEYIAETGPKGAEFAAKAREKATVRMAAFKAGRVPSGSVWELWTDRRFLRSIARALWCDVVAPRVQKPTAVVRPVLQAIVDLHSRPPLVESPTGQTSLRLTNGEATLERSSDTSLPTYTDNALSEIVRAGVGKLGSVTGHRLLRWELFAGHSRAMRNESDFRRLSIDGGWEALAEILGMNPKKSAADVRDIVLAQAHLNVPLPDGSRGNLLAVRHGPARGQRRGFVEIVLGSALLPGYVHELRERMGSTSHGAREAQRLVPVIDLPPFVGRPNEHGLQATLSLALVSYLRQRATEIVEEGGVRMTLDDFATLGQRAALKARALPAILDRWTQDANDGPALLKRTEPDRYTLGDAHAAARTFIEAAGRAEIGGRKGGRRRAAKHRAHLERLGRK